jgi:hypothetical protein
MAEEQKPVTQSDIDAMKNELAEIKNELMKKELEEIRREHMRKELEDIKAEREAKPIVSKEAYAPFPRLSIPTVLMAVLSSAVAGYLLGTLYYFDAAGTVNKLISGFSLPVTGFMVIAATSVLLLLIGIGLTVIAKR